MEQSAEVWCDGIVCARLWQDAVTVMPVCEGAAKLLVAEVIIPEELGDFSVPEDAYG